MHNECYSMIVVLFNIHLGLSRDFGTVIVFNSTCRHHRSVWNDNIAPELPTPIQSLQASNRLTQVKYGPMICGGYLIRYSRLLEWMKAKASNMLVCWQVI